MKSSTRKFCLSIALLTLTACTGSRWNSKDSEFYSALSPKPVASFHEEFTQADEAFFRFLRECIPNPTKDDIVMVSDPYDWDDLLLAMRRIIPGGFIFVDNTDPQVYRIMKNHHFQRLPFLWRTYDIYRAPARSLKASS